MIKYAIIGAGWRSEFYLKIAALLPNEFSVSGIYIYAIRKSKRNLRKNITLKYAELLTGF